MKYSTPEGARTRTISETICAGDSAWSTTLSHKTTSNEWSGKGSASPRAPMVAAFLCHPGKQRRVMMGERIYSDGVRASRNRRSSHALRCRPPARARRRRADVLAAISRALRPTLASSPRLTAVRAREPFAPSAADTQVGAQARVARDDGRRFRWRPSSDFAAEPLIRGPVSLFELLCLKSPKRQLSFTPGFSPVTSRVRD